MSDGLNPVLLHYATQRVWKQAAEKRGFQPPGGGAPPAGGAPPGMPPDPSAGGQAAPPGAMPGAPPGMPPGGGMPGAPGAAGPMDPMLQQAMGTPPGGMQPGMQQPGQKIKPEQWMQTLDYRLYNMQQQLTALMNAQGVQVPAGALVTPPGSPVGPPPESAMPGGPQDPSTQPGAAPPGGAGSAIQPVEPMQGASPELAAMGGGGEGGPKMAQALSGEALAFQKEAAANCPAGYRVLVVRDSEQAPAAKGPVKTAAQQFAASLLEERREPFQIGGPPPSPPAAPAVEASLGTKAAATAALLRSRAAGAR